MLAATGMFYREHPAAGVLEHTGAGVYYGASTTEAPVFTGRHVLVVGGGNSAGQSAMYLARFAKEVQIVVRRDGLRETMSQYLIEQIEKTPNIRLRVRTEIERVEGDGHVERIALKSARPRIEHAGRGRRAVCFYWHAPAQRVAAAERAARFQRLRIGRPRSDGGRRVCARVEGAPRTAAARDQRARGILAAGDLRAGAMNRVAFPRWAKDPWSCGWPTNTWR